MTACTCTDTPAIASECICTAHADAVRHLADARRAFRNETAARLWLASYSPTLGGVPLELILDGRGAAVAVEARTVGTAA